MSATLNVLLVEDYADSAMILARLLRRHGHNATIAGSCQAALEVASTERFDVVLCDLGLPDGSGLDLMRELKSRHSLRGILLTGYDMEEENQRCLEAGFEAHILKPVTIDKLLSVLEHRPSGEESSS